MPRLPPGDLPGPGIKPGSLALQAESLTSEPLAVLGLGCCTQAFPSYGEQGLRSGCGAWASHRGGSSCCGAQALGCRGSVVVAGGLSCPAACGIFLDQGSNPLPLHCQVDS